MDDLLPIRQIVEKYNLAADKKLGQNFLFDLNITDKIARSAGSLENVTVVEVGPGPGALTRSILAAGAKKVIAIEKDTRCINALNDYLVPYAKGRLEVVNGDALDMSLLDNIDGKIKIIANLPYNISTELLFRWLDIKEKFTSFTCMFQKEVAMRITAKPGGKDYGRLSVKTQLLCDTEHRFDVPPTVFYPPPKVNSSIITITPLDKIKFEIDIEKFDLVVKTLFSQRRKTIRSNLKQLSGSVSDLLDKINIDGNRRAETLTLEEFAKITNNIK